MAFFRMVRSREPFDKAIKFAKEVVYIDDQTVRPILNARKTILYHYDNIWSKNNNFDITTRVFDGAEVIDLI